MMFRSRKTAVVVGALGVVSVSAVQPAGVGAGGRNHAGKAKRDLQRVKVQVKARSEQREAALKLLAQKKAAAEEKLAAARQEEVSKQDLVQLEEQVQYFDCAEGLDEDLGTTWRVWTEQDWAELKPEVKAAIEKAERARVVLEQVAIQIQEAASVVQEPTKEEQAKVGAVAKTTQLLSGGVNKMALIGYLQVGSYENAAISALADQKTSNIKNVLKFWEGIKEELKMLGQMPTGEMSEEEEIKFAMQLLPDHLKEEMGTPSEILEKRREQMAQMTEQERQQFSEMKQQARESNQKLLEGLQEILEKKDQISHSDVVEQVYALKEKHLAAQFRAVFVMSKGEGKGVATKMMDGMHNMWSGVIDTGDWATQKLSQGFDAVKVSLGIDDNIKSGFEKCMRSISTIGADL